MPGQSAFIGALSGKNPGHLQGIIVPSALGSSQLAVNVNGNVIPARVLGALTVNLGDPVAVDFTAGGEAWIIGRLGVIVPSQATVTTVPPSSPTITVTGTDGQVYTATFLSSYTPTVNDVVQLAWNAGAPTVTGAVGSTAAPPPPSQPVAPPPSAPNTGTSTFPATDTSTWWDPGGWDSWAGGNNLFQGDDGQGQVRGAWFYGGAVSQLAGRTIMAIRFILGARNGAGASSSPVTVNLFTHTSASRPGTNVTLGSASTQVTANPYQPGIEYNLPTSFAADLLAGGGICINGNPYAGFAGRNAQPDSGTLSIDWSR